MKIRIKSIAESNQRSLDSEERSVVSLLFMIWDVKMIHNDRLNPYNSNNPATIERSIKSIHYLCINITQKGAYEKFF